MNENMFRQPKTDPQKEVINSKGKKEKKALMVANKECQNKPQKKKKKTRL